MRIMGWSLVMCALLLCGPNPAFASQDRGPAIEVHVAPNGNDANPGTEDKPFATLIRARDAVRALRAHGAVDVVIAQGTYYLPEALVLGPDDSGTEQCPVTWRADGDARVILSGGRPVSGRWKTEDGTVWCVDVPEAKERAWVFRQLFVDGKRITRARFPNRNASSPNLYALGGDRSTVRVSQGVVRESWCKALDVQINMVPKWHFFNQWNTVRGVDVEKGEVYLADSELNADIGEGDWFWIEGVREELDAPGEWFLDNDAGKLYYIPEPGADPNSQTVVAPYLNAIVQLKGDVEKGTHVEHVHFKGLEFRHTKFSLGHAEPRVHTDTAVLFENARNCGIEGCHFENIGGYALWLHLDCQRNEFDRNTVLHSGGGGVLMTGARFSYMDDTKVFTPGEAAARVFPILNHVTNNTVRHCGEIRYYGGGVHLDSRPASMAMAPGNYIGHNHFEDLSRNGVFAFRNQGGNVVEYNHIHNAMQTTIDGGCIHFATMNRLNAPNFIMNNWLHDIWGYEQKPDGNPKRHLANGVFLDWATSNTTVKNNYIYNAAGEPIKHIMGNWNIRIENNETAATRIVPPFADEVGPGGMATHGIDLNGNRLDGSVIHFSDKEWVRVQGDWTRRVMTGFWGLFTFTSLVATPEKKVEITYSLPVAKDGLYQVSLLYLPQAHNASNARVQVSHADGTDERLWNMQEGSEHGFAVEVGKYRFETGKPAFVRISNDDADGVVVADSVAFVKTTDGA